MSSSASVVAGSVCLLSFLGSSGLPSPGESAGWRHCAFLLRYGETVAMRILCSRRFHWQLLWTGWYSAVLLVAEWRGSHAHEAA